MRKRKFRDGFTRELASLVLPIVVQSLITSSVSLADTVMLGRVDQTSLSASSLAGQVQFLLNILFFGLTSAIVILASQYWGKKDSETIGRIFGIGLLISLSCSLAAFAGAFFAPQWLIRFWTNVPELIEAGALYLRFAAWSYLFAGITQPYLAVMKSCERVKLSTAISTVTFLLNVCLNAILIFGLLGFPAMGIIGAALATSISRGVETVLCLLDFVHQEYIPRSLRRIFAIPKELAGDFIRYSLPALVNDVLWALAYNMNSVIMGHLGSDITAASAMAAVVRDLISVVGFGISSASAILLGREIGQGRLEEARRDASDILYLASLACIVQGALLLLMSPVIPSFVRISDTARQYLRIMLYISVFYQSGQVINTLLISSFFRCGGDSRYGLRLDLFGMWGFAVPLGLLSAFVWKLPPIIVYALTCTDEFVKLPFALHHYFKGSWIRSLTRDFTGENACRE